MNGANHNGARRLYILAVLLILITGANFVYIVANWNSGREFQSIVGPAGPAGESGTPGIPGLQGPQGERGEQGEQGTPGARGPQGEAGPQGATGSAGQDGAPGSDGLDGLQGERGTEGPQGVAGVNGREVELRGNNDTAAIEWRYVGEADDAWRVLVRYCNLTNTCVVDQEG
jgi:hypothetical protein